MGPLQMLSTMASSIGIVTRGDMSVRHVLTWMAITASSKFRHSKGNPPLHMVMPRYADLSSIEQITFTLNNGCVGEALLGSARVNALHKRWQ